MSDGTTKTRHEPMVVEHYTLLPGGGRGDYREETVCVSCWVGCDDENCIEPHGNAPWPCEIARLRERVAELEAAGMAVVEKGDTYRATVHAGDDVDFGTRISRAAGELRAAEEALRAALAQAGDAREDSK